ncbi:MAG: tetratricopeptide repeat protein [Acidobacteriota bacterium]
MRSRGPQAVVEPRRGSGGRHLHAAVIGLALLVSACATRETPMPPVPVAPRYPEFRYPTAAADAPEELRRRLERGWRYLQGDDLTSAEREFEAALRADVAFYPADAAMGYLGLARQRPSDAVGRFERALERLDTYVPALVGRGRALLELNREDDALAAFEAALASDASLTDIRARIDVLRLRGLQQHLARATAAAEAERWDEARAAYGQAIAASPESAFLYRDLALIERRAGERDLALQHFRRAVALDATDVRSLVHIARILDEQGDPAGALAALERASAIDPSEVPDEEVRRLRNADAMSRMPAEFRTISTRTQASRADIAALIGARLASTLAGARRRQAVITDVRGHWAQPWITAVVQAGVMDTQPNYTFQPGAGLRRGDLAQIVSRVLGMLATTKPQSARSWQDARVQIADVPPGHLSYPAVSQAVASGVMPLGPSGAFDLLGAVSGPLALDVVGRLERMAAP